jgi:hypothetical protein
MLREGNEDPVRLNDQIAFSDALPLSFLRLLL